MFNRGGWTEKLLFLIWDFFWWAIQSSILWVHQGFGKILRVIFALNNRSYKVTRRQQLEEGWAGRRRLGQMLWPRRFGRPSPCSRCTWTPSSAWKGGWSWSWLPNSTDFFIGFLFRCCQLMPDQISDWSARWRPGRWWPRPWWLSDICYSPKKSGNLFWKHEKVTYLSWSHQQSKVPALGWKQELIPKFFPNCRWTTAREVQPRLFRFSSAWSAASVCEPSLCFQRFLLLGPGRPSVGGPRWDRRSNTLTHASLGACGAQLGGSVWKQGKWQIPLNMESV